MPSSVSDGSRPRMPSRRWYSAGVRPCSAIVSGVMAGLALASIRGLGGRNRMALGQLIAVGPTIVAPSQWVVYARFVVRVANPDTPAALALEGIGGGAGASRAQLT